MTAALRPVPSQPPKRKQAPAPKPPRHLAAPTRRWWTAVVESYELEEHHRRLLTSACEAWDRAEEAREILKAEGIVYDDRFGKPKPHPATAIERDARGLFAKLLRELDLDGAPEIDRRPPRLGRNR